MVLEEGQLLLYNQYVFWLKEGEGNYIKPFYTDGNDREDAIRQAIKYLIESTDDMRYELANITENEEE